MGGEIKGLPLVQQIRMLQGKIRGNEGLMKRIKEDPQSVPLIANPEDQLRIIKHLGDAQYDLINAQLQLKIAKATIEPKLPGTDSGDLFESVDNLVAPDATKTAPKVAKEVKDNKKTAQK